LVSCSLFRTPADSHIAIEVLRFVVDFFIEIDPVAALSSLEHPSFFLLPKLNVGHFFIGS
jgi:hypothetical protein